MELSEHPEVAYRGQDAQAVRVRVCFRGKVDHGWYCVNLRIPKDKLLELHGSRTALDEPELEA
jgi:hypothetical protein